jgi:hypothetical protein
MYKVLLTTNHFLTNKISKETDFQLFLLESIDIEQLIIKIFQNKIQKPISIIPMKRNYEDFES